MKNYKLYNKDCLKVMNKITPNSVDLVLCDLPYGVTQNEWDAVIPFDQLWEHYDRVCKSNAAIVLTAIQPFTSLLITSNLKMFKYVWVWDKGTATGFLNAKKQPMRQTEDVAVFYNSQPTYNPQMSLGTAYTTKRGSRSSSNYGKHKSSITVSDGQRYPKNLLSISGVSSVAGLRVHPTQKPIPLMEYFINTYTNEGDVVLDNCMGSGSTGVACMNTDRKFIGIEKDEKYYKIAESRILEATTRRNGRLFK